MKPGEQWWELVASTLRQLRAQRNLSQMELENRTDISQGLISRYERGAADPGIGKLLVLLEAMDFSLQDFAEVLDQTRASESGEAAREESRKPSTSPPDPHVDVRQEAFFLMRVTDEEVRQGRPEELRQVASMFDCLRDFFQTQVRPLPGPSRDQPGAKDEGSGDAKRHRRGS